MGEYREKVAPGLYQVLAGQVVYEQHTLIGQHVVIFDSTALGRTLFLNGVRRTSWADQHIYYEMLIQPAMMVAEQIRNVLIVGGSEGAMVREVLRWPEVERLVHVDIDREVIDLCVEYLPQWSVGAYTDPRYELVCTDATEYLAHSQLQFDVIIGDGTDYQAGTPAAVLHSPSPYVPQLNSLAPGGVIALQVGHAIIAGRTELRSVITRLRRACTAIHLYAVADLGWVFGLVRNSPLPIAAGELVPQRPAPPDLRSFQFPYRAWMPPDLMQETHG